MGVRRRLPDDWPLWTNSLNPDRNILLVISDLSETSLRMSRLLFGHPILSHLESLSVNQSHPYYGLNGPCNTTPCHAMPCHALLLVILVSISPPARNKLEMLCLPAGWLHCTSVLYQKIPKSTKNYPQKYQYVPKIANVQGPTRNTAHRSRATASTSATATPMPLARRKPMWVFVILQC